MAGGEMNFQGTFQDELEAFNTNELMGGGMQPEQYPVQDAIGQPSIMMVPGIDHQVSLQPQQIHTIQQPIQQQLHVTSQDLQTAVVDHTGQFLISQAVTPVTVVQSTGVAPTAVMLSPPVRLQPQQRSIAVVSSQSEMPHNPTQGRRTIIVQAQPAPPAPEVVAKPAPKPAAPVKTVCVGRRGAGKAGGTTQRKKKDPNAPAPVLTAYRSFFKEISQSVKTRNPAAKFGDVSKIVASMWEAMPDEEKASYRKKSEEDKIRFRREMEEYKARQDGQDPSSDPVSDPPSDPVEPTSETTSMDTSNIVKESPTAVTAAPPETYEQSGTTCIRKDCNNQAVRNPEWEDEYCSDECVVKHCTNVFNDWVLQNRNNDLAVS